jgi:hypothetical protein
MTYDALLAAINSGNHLAPPAPHPNDEPSFAPIADALRTAAANGTLPSLAFMEKAEQVGRQELEENRASGTTDAEQ